MAKDVPGAAEPAACLATPPTRAPRAPHPRRRATMGGAPPPAWRPRVTSAPRGAALLPGADAQRQMTQRCSASMTTSLGAGKETGSPPAPPGISGEEHDFTPQADLRLCRVHTMPASLPRATCGGCGRQGQGVERDPAAKMWRPPLPTK